MKTTFIALFTTTAALLVTGCATHQPATTATPGATPQTAGTEVSPEDARTARGVIDSLASPIHRQPANIPR